MFDKGPRLQRLERRYSQLHGDLHILELLLDQVRAHQNHLMAQNTALQTRLEALEHHLGVTYHPPTTETVQRLARFSRTRKGAK